MFTFSRLTVAIRFFPVISSMASRSVRMLLSTLERESVLQLVNLKQPLLGFHPNMYRHD